MNPHPTHSFQGSDEGYLCRDCDVRKGSERSGEACPAFVDDARRLVRETARALFLSMPICPPTAGEAAAAHDECRAALDAGREWAMDASLRSSTCRTLAQLLGVEVDVDASLIQMARA